MTKPSDRTPPARKTQGGKAAVSPRGAARTAATPKGRATKAPVTKPAKPAAGNDPSPRPRGSVARPRRLGPQHRWSAPMRAVIWTAAAAVVVVVLFVFVFPTRTYLDQRHQIDLATQRIKVLDAQNAQLSQEADRLRSADEIKRIARAQYHMVEPGAQAFVVLPAPLPPTTVAPAPPPSSHHGGWWHDLTSWIP